MWSQKPFTGLRQLLESAPVLAYLKFRLPFILETAASGSGLGAVLTQAVENGSVRPIAYASRSLQDHDHEALKSLLNNPQPSGKLARWGMTIQELDACILHWSGKHNSNADALSRAGTVRSRNSKEQEQ